MNETGGESLASSKSANTQKEKHVLTDSDEARLRFPTLEGKANTFHTFDEPSKTHEIHVNATVTYPDGSTGFLSDLKTGDRIIYSEFIPRLGLTKSRLLLINGAHVHYSYLGEAGVALREKTLPKSETASFASSSSRTRGTYFFYADFFKERYGIV